MYDLLRVLIDESDLLTKDQALHLLALHWAHADAQRRGLSALSQPYEYGQFVFPRCDEIEAKLRQLIGIGPA